MSQAKLFDHCVLITSLTLCRLLNAKSITIGTLIFYTIYQLQIQRDSIEVLQSMELDSPLLLDNMAKPLAKNTSPGIQDYISYMSSFRAELRYK